MAYAGEDSALYLANTKTNWTIQSSGVDYLHLIMLSMRWFNDIWDLKLKLVLAIHDEVRFMVPNKNTRRAALAMHLTNMYIRAYFSARVGFIDLPAEVTFFTGVDIDTQLRKDPTDQAKTI